MKKIDIHAHIIPLGIFGKAGRWGPEVVKKPDGDYLRSGSMMWNMKGLHDMDLLTDPHARLKDMDKRGVDAHIISSGPVFYLYGIDHELLLSWTCAFNDFSAGWCRTAPDRYYFAANLPLADVDASIKEIRRAAELGARAFSFGAPALGRSLDDGYFHPLYEEIEKLNLPIFVHPMAQGMDKDDGTQAESPKMDFSTNVLLDGWGMYLNEETMTIVKLIMSGTLDKFPRLNFYITHGGGAIPYQFGRFETAAQRMPKVNKAKRPLASYLRNFYFDPIVHDVRARRLLVDFMGAENVVVGSNYQGWDAFDGFAAIEELQLIDSVQEKIFSGNVARLCKIAA